MSKREKTKSKSGTIATTAKNKSDDEESEISESSQGNTFEEKVLLMFKHQDERIEKNLQKIMETIGAKDAIKDQQQNTALKEGFQHIENKMETQFREEALRLEQLITGQMDKNAQETLSEIIEKAEASNKEIKGNLESIRKRISEIERNLVRKNNREEEDEDMSPIIPPVDSSFRRQPIPERVEDDGNNAFRNRMIQSTTNEEPRKEKDNAGKTSEKNWKRVLDNEMRDDPEQIAKDLRRDSVYGRLLHEDTEDRQGKGRLTLESDEHRHIIWKERTIDGFMEFLTKIYHFTKSYEQKVPNIYTHISQPIQQIVQGILTIHKGSKFKDLGDIYRADLRDIYQAAEIMFAPTDMLHFNKLLYSSCKNYAVYMRNERDFERARIGLYILRQKFKERYDFLIEGANALNRTECLPPINFKQGGIFEIWFSFTPEQIRDSFKQILQKKRYETYEDFSKAYFELVDDTYEKSEQAKIVNRLIRSTQSFNVVEEDEFEEEY